MEREIRIGEADIETGEGRGGGGRKRDGDYMEG